MQHLCRDCRWYRPAKLGKPGEFAECASPNNVSVRRTRSYVANVTGDADYFVDETLPKYRFCSTHRSPGPINALFAWLGNFCGPQGYWWEPR